MTVYTLTLTSIQRGGGDHKSLRDAFNDEWKAVEPIVRAVPGVEVLRVGRFGTTVTCENDDARNALETLLPQRWELVPPGPPATLLTQGPRC